MLLKKAWHLSKNCNLKVKVVIFDEETNVMQEFKSCPNMNSEAVALHKRQNPDLKLNPVHFANQSRKSIPRRNCIEESDMAEVLQGYKMLRGGQGRGDEARREEVSR